MAEFTKLLVTDRGSALVMKALQGKGIIRFTRLAASSRQYQEEDIKGLTSLEDIRQQGDISEMDAEGSSSIRLRVALPNIDLTEGYYIRTVGLYANDPDEGEILYGVSMETSAGGCYVPAYNHQIVSSLYFHISVAVGNAENVSLEVDAGALVTRKQLDAVQQRITDEVKVLQEGMEEKADGTAFDNYKSATDTLLGNTDITGIGDGTVTGAIRELNTGIGGIRYNTDTDYIQILANGKWINWKRAQVQSVVLFDGQTGKGQLNKELSGGFGNISTDYGTSITYSNTAITMKTVGQDTQGCYAPIASSHLAIDLTQYDKLRMHVSNFVITPNTSKPMLRVSKEKNYYNNTTTRSTNINEKGWQELDVSDLQGTYYILFGGSVNTNFTCYIDYILLK